MTDQNQIVTNIDHHDDDIIATTLLNVTIMAANRRGGRQMLNVEDFNAFKAMLAASNAIQPTLDQPRAPKQKNLPQESPEAASYAAVADAIGQRGATMPPPNLML